jgi:hypothetical protein
MTEGGRFSSHLAAFRKAEQLLSNEEWFRNGAWNASVSVYGPPGFERGCGIHLHRSNSEGAEKPVVVDSWITQADLKRRRVPISVQESVLRRDPFRNAGARRTDADRSRLLRSAVETIPFTIDSLADVLVKAIRERSLDTQTSNSSSSGA